MTTAIGATSEQDRILAEYRRREAEQLSDRYAPWQPAEMFMRNERRRVAATMLHRAGAFPQPGQHCLEIGYGCIGWLGELVSWGIPSGDLHGMELDATRAAVAQAALPAAELLVGDAAALPWPDDSFACVVTSTVFTSILDGELRRMIATEITRVLAPGGALLWYDFAVNNPRNPHVRGIPRRELRELFPRLQGEIRSITLAPPLARLLTPRAWPLAMMLECIPWLRTHLLAVLKKARTAN